MVTGRNSGIFETKEEQAKKRIFADFIKEIEQESKGIKDNNLIGYIEAILNIAGEFNNGQCEDCPFSGVEEIAAPDFITPEYGLTCYLNECWIDKIKKLIWKEQEQIRKKAKLTNDILEKSYDEIISSKDFSKMLRGRITMEELYKHIRKNYIKKLTVAQFKRFMQEFYEKYPLGNFSFERASTIHAEVARYGFITKRGVCFYMHKG